MNPNSGPSSPDRASTIQIPVDSFSTPDKSTPQHSSSFIDALEKILPGINGDRLIHAIDTVTENQHSYTIIGSAALYLQALSRESDDGQRALPSVPLSSLPLPADLDLVVTPTALGKIENASDDTLKNLGLSRQEERKHVFYIDRMATEATGENSPLKIDFIPADSRSFRGYSSDTRRVFGQRVANHPVILEHYKSRLQDPDYVKESGGESKVKAKVDAWTRYFQPVAGSAGTAGPSTGQAGPANDASTDVTGFLGRRPRLGRVLFQNIQADESQPNN